MKKKSRFISLAFFCDKWFIIGNHLIERRESGKKGIMGVINDENFGDQS